MAPRGGKTIAQIAGRIRLIVLDFDGVMTDNRVLVLQDGTEGVFCNRSDGLGIEIIRKLGVMVFVLSKEKNPVVSARCRKLNIPCIQSCDNKAEVLKSEAARMGIPLGQVAYMGNDINDLECLRLVGLPACVSDSHPKVIPAARLKTKARGGFGAVRELCDLIIRHQHPRQAS